MLPAGHKRKWIPNAAVRVLVRDFAVSVRDGAGHGYLARAYAETGRLGTWVGFLEFEPEAPADAVLRTELETTQSSVGAVAYWASGLSEEYLGGALERARERQSSRVR